MLAKVWVIQSWCTCGLVTKTWARLIGKVWYKKRPTKEVVGVKAYLLMGAPERADEYSEWNLHLAVHEMLWDTSFVARKCCCEAFYTYSDTPEEGDIKLFLSWCPPNNSNRHQHTLGAEINALDFAPPKTEQRSKVNRESAETSSQYYLSLML